MQSIEISVKRADLANILSAMREWLDRERCSLLHFRHADGGVGMVVISAGFAAGDVCAEAFRRYFDDAI
jgi:hypothetical protein